MIRALRQSGRWELAWLLFGMSVLCFTLSLARMQATGTRQYLFLNWNLFLAAIPWMATSAVTLHARWRSRRLALLALLAVWILFFPNSPYILTDLFHLRSRTGAPLWFDLALILSFAWTGLAFGFASLLDIERLVLARLPRPWPAVSAAGLLFLSGFGIYLGRYLRWNSWDVIQAPLALLHDVGARLADPLDHPRTWGVTLTMGLLLNMMFWTLKLLRRADAGI